MKMVRFIFAFLGISVFFAEAQTQKICQLGMDPVDIKKGLNKNDEVLVKIDKHQSVTMTTGSGKKVSCVLPAGTAVVVEKSTGVARWIYNCGNKIETPQDWTPGGVREEFTAEVLSQQLPQSTTVFTQAPAVSGEISHSGKIEVIHSGEVSVLLKQIPTEPVKTQNWQYQSSRPQTKSWWQRNRKWVIPLVIAGAAGGAYAATSGDNGSSSTIYYQPLPPPIKR